MHSRPEAREKIGLIRSNWLIYRIFCSKKSKVTAILGALEQKVHNPRTQKRCQNDRDTQPIKVRHWNPRKITYKQVKIAFKNRSLGVNTRWHNLIQLFTTISVTVFTNSPFQTFRFKTSTENGWYRRIILYNLSVSKGYLKTPGRGSLYLLEFWFFGQLLSQQKGLKKVPEESISNLCTLLLKKYQWEFANG